MNYKVVPGLYTIGNPTADSPVMVTASYRMSCNALRKALESRHAWVLVLDTKGINVWCAAGKGTFGTAELINRISRTGLAGAVKHRSIVLPQLGAPGVAAQEVKNATGFTVHYGPVKAHDLPAYLETGNKATQSMRSVGFPMRERLVLTPMELFPALRKFLWVVLGCIVVMGMQPTGVLYKVALWHSLPILVAGLVSVIIGTVITPVFLPFIPFRSFAAKGALAAVVVLAPLFLCIEKFFCGNIPLACSSYLFFVAIASYLALNFTGCTPFTNISGVKKEMRFAVPAYLTACGISAVLLILFKVHEWGLL